MPRTFDLDRLDAIVRGLHLDAVKRRTLIAIIIRIGETIDTHRKTMESRMPRAERNKLLRDMAKALTNLENTLTSLGGYQDRTLSGIYAAMLGHQLSNAGIEAGLGREMSWPESSSWLFDSRLAREHEEPYRALEIELYRPVRESIVRAHTPEVLQGFLRQLRQRLEAFLALDREQNKGGVQGKRYRRHAIAVLAEAFPSLFGVKPTSSPGGDFCTLCEHVLPELGEDTEGLETAIQRVLEDIRA